MSAGLYKHAEAAAEDARSQLAKPEPPVDVEGLASSMGVTRIISRPLVGDGQLLATARGRVILVDPRAGIARRRFTIAHELGHVWLRRQQSQELLLRRATEERFCNAFAAALLLPKDWIRGRAMECDPGLDGLREISDQASVSMGSCLIRLHRFPRWRRVLAYWRWDQGDWRLWSVVGSNLELRSQINTVPKTRAAITYFHHKACGTQRHPLWLGIGTEERQVDAEIAVDGPRALALLSVPEQFL